MAFCDTQLPFDQLLTQSTPPRGEQTAQALESNLTTLEKKIDDLLASFEDSERSMVEEATASTSTEKPSAGDHTGAADDKAKSQQS